jgi:hypothetical protein
MSSFATPMAAIWAALRTICRSCNKFEWMAKKDFTVADSKARRFSGIYPGLAIHVLDGGGNAVAGDTKLGTLRDSYTDE